ncbi:DUF3526 domain-containing protein [Aurantivibrio plasticivorans]
MKSSNAFIRETKFAARDRSLWFWLIVVVALSTISISFGLTEVARQNATLERLVISDQQDRWAELKKQQDWGSAAYYSFHLTYDAPSDFTFAAMGLRDQQPWKHRIRMLALEGQIYERDVANPSVALIGRFDFAFLAAFVIPLVLIMLLYDLRASERTAGRLDLLESTTANTLRFWLTRMSLRASAVFLCVTLPLIVGGLIASTAPGTLFLASCAVFIYIAFWSLICFYVASWKKSSATLLMTLVSAWLTTAVIVPAGARLAIDQLVPVPSGADILLLQRETVNDAWDLPRETTMDAFFERHPEWSNYQPVESSFEWPWYYAFQQVGDQRTEDLANAYRDGRQRRDHLAAWTSLLAPPSLLERWLQKLARTDLESSIHYENSVRAYHQALRDFYYPKFFSAAPFDKSLLAELPKYRPTQSDGAH